MRERAQRIGSSGLRINPYYIRAANDVLDGWESALRRSDGRSYEKRAFMRALVEEMEYVLESKGHVNSSRGEDVPYDFAHLMSSMAREALEAH